MTKIISFSDEILLLEAASKQHKAELGELEARHKQYDLQTAEARQALDALRTALGVGVFAPKRRGRPRSTPSDALEVNPQSGRPSRGARRDQIEDICRTLGQRNANFRTAEVLKQLREIEGELSDGMRSYTYALMTTLQDEGLVNKVDRGRWELVR
ncbi:MAG: hypothetical protein H0U74_23400 [Bradymonadaceae bacterium]|nr:hypothetical protein [Lujinxingiaceae bacterium]